MSIYQQLFWLVHTNKRKHDLQKETDTQITFALLVDSCKQRGISRTTAWKLCKEGLIESFNIGSRKYVILESLRTLPERLAEQRENMLNPKTEKARGGNLKLNSSDQPPLKRSNHYESYP